MEHIHAQHGVCVGPHPFTADAGVAMLRDGGNALDAAVAAAFVEAVVEPAHNGVAGYGGALVAYLAEQRKVVVIDFNMRAPAAATEDMYEVAYHADGNFSVKDRAHLYGERSVGVCGVVGGLCSALQQFGALPLEQVLQPAIKTARDGWTVNLNSTKAIDLVLEPMRQRFPETVKLLRCKQRSPQPGDTLNNPELAATLTRIAQNGPSEFYRGQTGRAIVDHLRAGGNCVTLEDWATYQTRLCEPLQSKFKDLDLFTPPLCVGGLTTLQILRVYEGLDIPDPRRDLVEAFHLHLEVMKACWRERLLKYGDPRFVQVDVENELGDRLISELRERVRQALRNPHRGELIAPEPFNCTSHICAADVRGNMVSLTQTHGAALGSLVTVPGTGLTLGHGMARFDPRPGRPNSIAGGKEPLHNMAPMIALKDGRPFAAYGAPGGRTIPNNQAYFTLNMFHHQMSPLEAITLPRVHCDSIEPGKIEERAGQEVIQALRARGHDFALQEKVGGPAHVILLGERPDEFVAATDVRGQGKTAYG